MAATKRDTLKQRGGTTPSGITDLMARMAAGVQNTDALAVVVAPDKTIHIGDSFIIRETGLEIAEHVGRDEWLQFMGWLNTLEDTLQWAYGDATVFADARRAAWIEAEGITEIEMESKYQELIESTGYSYSSLSKFASFARRFPPFRRRKTLSYSHHVEVASLTEAQQDALLDQAESSGWSRNELRKAVQKVNAPGEAGPDDNTACAPEVVPSPAPEEEAREIPPAPLPLEHEENWQAMTFIRNVVKHRKYTDLTPAQTTALRREIAIARAALSLLEVELSRKRAR